MFRSVVLPTITAAVLLAAFVGVVLLAATGRSDALALERQTRLVSSALANARTQIATEQEASTLWDDAVLRLRAEELDPEWMDNNLGVWFFTYYHHDETHVLDPRLSPVYSMRFGERRDSAAFSLVAEEVLPLARTLRSRIRTGYWAEEGSEQTIGVAEVLIVNRRPAIVSLKPIVPESDEIVHQPGTEFIHVSLRYLDGNFLQSLGRQLQLDEPSFAWRTTGKASVPLLDNAGKAVGHTPGSRSRREARSRNA